MFADPLWLTAHECEWEPAQSKCGGRGPKQPLRGRIVTALLSAASAFCSAIAGPSSDIAGRPVSDPALPPQQHVNAPIAIAHPRFRDLLDPLPKLCLLGSLRTVVIGRSLARRGKLNECSPAIPPVRGRPSSEPVPTHPSSGRSGEVGGSEGRRRAGFGAGFCGHRKECNPLDIGGSAGCPRQNSSNRRGM